MKFRSDKVSLGLNIDLTPAIDDIDITFFAKHSGSISGMIRHLTNEH